MLISDEYSGIYVKEQLFHLVFYLVEISSALENLSENPNAFQDAFAYRFFFTEQLLKYNGG